MVLKLLIHEENTQLRGHSKMTSPKLAIFDPLPPCHHLSLNLVDPPRPMSSGKY